MKQAPAYLIPLLCALLPKGALASIDCERKIPRCTPGTCSVWGPDAAKDWVYGAMLAGSHQSPNYAQCPSGGAMSACTDDFFRSPSSWDYVASTADYQYIWYASNPDPDAESTVWIRNDSLKNQLTAGQWNAVASISYVDIDVGWSTYNPQTIVLGYAGTNGSQWLLSSPVTGDYPNGTMIYWRMTADPSSGGAWDKNQFGTYRRFGIANGGVIDANHPGGLFIHSITETVGFQYAGTACP